LEFRRKLPIGAEPIAGNVTDVRVWAPIARRVEVVIASAASYPLVPEPGGYFRGRIPAGAGARYQFRIDGGDHLYPDPASRFQPDGPHAASEIVDAASFRWSDADWRGATIDDQVIYEMHVGTFTQEGTWAAAAAELPELSRAGITMIEMMPVAEFEGHFGWGYDGVDLFAPSHLYGRPADLRAFIDAAHRLGVAVILDVVYNHLGPVGNYLRAFSPGYFTTRYDNEWGDAINFDGDDAAPVREYFIANAGYWIDEFHFDGLRLDATQQIFDASPEHILTAIGTRARAAAGRRSIVLVAENERQDARLVEPIAHGGYGLDALWNDDFHHSAMVALTGRAEAYYSDTRGEAQEFISSVKYGYLFQGQFYRWQQQPRGTPAWGLRPTNFVTFLQNHDQVANSARGFRAERSSSPARWRAMTALLLLGPAVPLLFQGQEFGASAPFLYFADFEADVAAAIRKGRGEFLAQFPSVVDFAARDALADPSDRSTFERCRLDLRERGTHAASYALHIDLLRLRREDPAIRLHGSCGIDGAVLSPNAFVLRFFSADHADDRLLVVNLGTDLRRPSFAEPLTAPPGNSDWVVAWCSEDPAYGGSGVPEILPIDGQWNVPAESAIVLRPGPRRDWPKWPKEGAKK
jgi:maltooligosyltrehalose trehalohydrolase